MVLIENLIKNIRISILCRKGVAPFEKKYLNGVKKVFFVNFFTTWNIYKFYTTNAIKAYLFDFDCNDKKGIQIENLFILGCYEIWRLMRTLSYTSGERMCRS